MRRDPTHPDADGIANDGKDERGEHDSPDPDFGTHLQGFHGTHHGMNSAPALKTFTGGKPDARVMPCLWI
jgi:hypothetical protein